MSKTINLSTIGFTQKTAQEFFKLLKEAKVKRVIDTRLNNVSQLAGFAKKKDLQYFLKEIANIDYIHLVDLAPTKDILDDYKKKKGEWSVYEKKFRDLITKREIEKKLDPKIIEDSCLLCSEAKPHHCHRRLVAEYLSNHWGNINIVHL
ncbi:MAG: DUF488 domain-containing protein [Crocosphaera sp.]|nr:DUF488 domain-containing protein [Crocosphaera sp.]